MADKYYDPTATGADDGSSQADAWQTIQKAADNAVAGDKVLMRYTATPEALGADCQFDTNAGGPNNPIEFVGVNGSWVEDGTQCVIDGDSTANYPLRFYGAADYLAFRNVRVINALHSGWRGENGSVRISFDNCTAENSVNNGFVHGSSGAAQWAYRFCKAINNNVGWNSPYYTHLYGCQMIGNSIVGIDISTSHLEKCIIHGNAIGVKTSANQGFSIDQCVIDGNTADGIEDGGSPCSIVMACRITNNGGVGIKHTGGDWLYDFCVIVGNGTNVNSASGFLRDGGHNSLVGADGYVDRAADNFTTKTDAQLRREAYQPF